MEAEKIDEIGKDFHLMLTGCMEKWPRIIYQNTSYRFDEYNRTIVLDGGHSYDIVETEDYFPFYCRMIRALIY